MYKHDTPNILGVNAYIKYQWDKTMKVQLVSEGQFKKSSSDINLPLKFSIYSSSSYSSSSSPPSSSVGTSRFTTLTPLVCSVEPI
jgi:hypothetical protein